VSVNRSTCFVLVFLTVGVGSCRAQSAPQQVNDSSQAPDASALRQRARENEIAGMISQMRAHDGRKGFKRVRSSAWEIQLTCTAAVKNRPLESWVGIQIFRVHSVEDLSADPAYVKLMGSRPGEDVSRYSVTVFLDPNSKPEQSRLVVGIFPQESRSDHLKGCLFTEDGCNDSSYLKKMVTPACRDVR
jgi:hypothetical protein